MRIVKENGYTSESHQNCSMHSLHVYRRRVAAAFRYVPLDPNIPSLRRIKEASASPSSFSHRRNMLMPFAVTKPQQLHKEEFTR